MEQVYSVLCGSSTSCAFLSLPLCDPPMKEDHVCSDTSLVFSLLLGIAPKIKSFNCFLILLILIVIY